MKINKIIKALKKGSFISDVRDFLFIRLVPFYSFILKNKRVNKKKIVFSNFYGRGYGDNPKYIAEYILSHNLDYDLVWLIDPKRCIQGTDLPNEVRMVRYKSYKSVKELATAGYWIDNCRKDYFPEKKASQVYIQTWHGTFLTKKIEGEADNLLDSYVKAAKRDSKAIDYLLSSNAERTKQLKRCFWYEGPIIETGCPRDDILFRNESTDRIKSKVYNYFNISKDKKVVLYVPTFRNSYSVEPYNVDYKKLLESLEKRFGCKWVVIIRLHPGMISFVNKLNLPDYVIQGTFYNDIQELLCASDVILTDYSSMGDYSLYLKPLFMYCPDLEEYKKERAFEVPIESYPFPLAHDNEELSNNIINFDVKSYEEKLKNYYDMQGLVEGGKACEKVMEIIEGGKEC